MPQNAPRSRATGIGRIVTTLAAVSALAVASGCIVVPVADLLRPPPLEETVIERGAGVFYQPKIAIIDLEGVITGRESYSLVSHTDDVVAEVAARLRRVERDPEVVGLVLRIASPGGEVTACDEIRQRLLAVKRARKIPVVASIGDTGASGGYYIAAAADHIVAQPTSVVGSIGVLMQNVNVAGLFEKIGVSMLTVQSGGFKDLVSPFRPVREEEVQVLQELVDRMHARFVDVVDEGRAGLDRDEVVSIADGRVYTGERARELGLVDEVGYIEDAVRKTRALARVAGTGVVRYTRAGRNVGAIGPLGITSPTSDEDGGVSLHVTASELPRVRFLYLWAP